MLKSTWNKGLLILIRLRKHQQHKQLSNGLLLKGLFLLALLTWVAAYHTLFLPKLLKLFLTWLKLLFNSQLLNPVLLLAVTLVVLPMFISGV